jgi:recombination protein RecT
VGDPQIPVRRQAAHYLRGLAAAGTPVEGFGFIAIESDAPHAVGVYMLDDGDLIEADEELTDLLSPLHHLQADRAMGTATETTSTCSSSRHVGGAHWSRSEHSGRQAMTLALTDHGNETQVVARRYEPRMPVGSAQGLKGLLEASKASIMQALPKHVTPERLIKTMLVAANRTPKLFDCTQSSVLETINRAAELGLDLSGTLGEAYPVPYGNTCQLIIGYRGLEKLAWQSGELASIDAEVVYEKDDFKFRKGTEVVVEWTPYMGGDRGKPIGAYACVTMKGGGKLARFLPYSDIEKVRKVSRSGQSGPWKDWWDEMARKTALRRVLKDAPLSTEKFVAAMEHDTEQTRFDDVLEASTGSSRSLAAKFNAAAVDPDTQLPEHEIIDRIQAPASPAPVDEDSIAHAADAAPLTQPGEGEPDVSGAEAEAPEGGIPPHGRTSASWINDLILMHKGELTKQQAVKAFHSADVMPWEKLPAERQDAKHAQLVGGAFPWKK